MTCNKVGYTTEREASEKLKLIRKKARKHVPRRYYKCECGLYHLTKEIIKQSADEKSTLNCNKIEKRKSTKWIRL